MKLTFEQLIDLARRYGAHDGAEFAAAVGAILESGGDTDIVGDQGCSIGLWQINTCAGLGVGIDRNALRSPDLQAQIMIPVYQRYWDQGSGLPEEDRAVQTYMYAERPAGFPNLSSPVAQRYRQLWRAYVGSAKAPQTPGQVVATRGAPKKARPRRRRRGTKKR
jgi:hypothetical protein